MLSFAEWTAQKYTDKTPAANSVNTGFAEWVKTNIPTSDTQKVTPSAPSVSGTPQPTLKDLEKQLAELDKQSADLTSKISGLSRGLAYDRSGAVASQKAQYEAELAKINEQSASLKEQKKPLILTPAESWALSAASIGKDIVGFGERIPRSLASTGYNLLGGITSLFGLADNPVSDTLHRFADAAWENTLEDKIEQKIEERYGEKMTDKQRFSNQIGEAGINLLGALATGQAATAAAGLLGAGGSALSTAGTAAKVGTIAQNVAFGTSAGASYAKEAYAKTGDSRISNLYGLLGGLLELGTEHIAGGIAGFKGNTLAQKLMARLGKAPQTVQTLLNVGGEGLEEAVTTALTPFLQRLTYDKDAKAASFDEYADSFWSGVVLSAVSQGGAVIANAVDSATQNRNAADALTTPQGVAGATQAQSASTTLDELAVRENAMQSATAQVQKNGVIAASEINGVSPEGSHDSDAAKHHTGIISNPVEQIKANILQNLESGIKYSAKDVTTEQAEAFSELYRAGKIQMSANSEFYIPNPKSHIDNRNLADVGKKNVKSFQYENPQLHNFFVDAAGMMQDDLNNTTKGERGAAYAYDYMADSDAAKTSGYVWWGTKRDTTRPIATIKDDIKLSYNDIYKALDAIIDDKGQENYAAAKRVEIILDGMLTNGYKNIRGEIVPPNEAYIEAKSKIAGATPISSYETVSEELPLGYDFPDGMGAATQGFNPYSALQNQYGTFEAKENPARVVDVPLKDAQGRNVTGTAQTVMEAQATPDALIPTIEQAIVDGDFSYDVFTDKAAQEQANSTIKSKGFQQALTDWAKDVAKGKVNKSNTALGWTLYNNAANMVSNPNATAEQKTEASKTAVAILTDTQAHERSAAQALQAQRMLKKMSPEYQLYSLQKSAQSIADELTAKHKTQYDITIDPALVQEFMEVAGKDADAQAAVEKKIRRNIASQVPSTFMDKWNAWRYLAMLGNPRTHIRNFVGNAGFMPVRMMKNVVAASIEAGAQKVGILNERTKSVLTLSKEDRARMSLGWADYTNVVDTIQSGGKYDDARSAIDRERTIFGLKPLEWLRVTNTTALDTADTKFSRPAYAESLASYLKANGITADGYNAMTAAEKAKAQEYAIKEAQKATYRDHNAFSDFVARLGKNYQGDNKAAKAANIVLEGVLPFKRTPANLVVRAAEYSPLGLAKALTYDIVQVKKGNMSATEMIDNLSSGLVGSAVVGLGMYLASLGLISGGGGSDDKQDEFNELQGKQAYAVTIGDKTFTLDWLAPEAIPFFMGVEIFNRMTDNSENGLTLDEALKTASKLTDPMLEMSMLQGVQDVIEGVKYSESPLVGAIANAATGYLTQGAPTLFGQIERTFAEDTRQSTFVDKNSGVPSNVQILLGKTFNKLPGEYNQIDYIDAWGRTTSTGTPLERAVNNFISPAYSSEVKTTAVDKELQRLYDTGADGTSNIFPSKAEKSITINKTKINMTAEDYVEYAKTKGQTAYKTVSGVIESSQYKRLTDSEKAAVISRAYTYADYVAKSKLFDEYSGDKWLDIAAQSKRKLGVSLTDYLFLCEKYGTSALSQDKLQEAHKSGVDAKTYLDFRYENLPKYDVNANRSFSQDEVTGALQSMKGLSNSERATLWQMYNTQWKNNPFA